MKPSSQNGSCIPTKSLLAQADKPAILPNDPFTVQKQLYSSDFTLPLDFQTCIPASCQLHDHLFVFTEFDQPINIQDPFSVICWFILFSGLILLFLLMLIICFKWKTFLVSDSNIVSIEYDGNYCDELHSSDFSRVIQTQGSS